MYRESYIHHSKEHVSNDTYYKNINRDPKSTIHQNANKSKWKLDGTLPDEMAGALSIYNSIAPKFDALPKIHKPCLGIRPIIGSIISPWNKLGHSYIYQKFLQILMIMIILGS